MLVGLSAILIGASAAWGYRALTATQQEDALSRLVSLESRRLGAALVELRNDVALIAQLSQGGTHSDLSRLLVALLTSKPSYEQARLLSASEGGRELVRVERTTSGVRAVPEAQLLSKGHRDYFKAALRVPPGQVYLSEIDLNREAGKVQVPHTPTLRAVVVIRAADGSPSHLAVINLNAGKSGDQGESLRAQLAIYATVVNRWENQLRD